MTLTLSLYIEKLQISEDGSQVFDPIRKIWVRLTPEESVRQAIILYLIHDRKYPRGHIGVEKKIKYHNLDKRYDLVVYTKKGQPEILVECKSPRVNLSQKALDQTQIYNEMLSARYLWISNGHSHLIFECDYSDKSVHIIDEVVPYSSR